MNAKLLHEAGGQRTFVLIFDTSDEVMSNLLAFAKSEHLTGSNFTAIGALQHAVIGYFDWNRKDYKKIPIEEQVEVLSLIGDVAESEQGDHKVHAHVVLGRSDGTTLGGHLLKADVRPTLEVMLTESPTHLRRRHDPVSGLALIRV